MGRTLVKISAKPTTRQTDKCRAAIQTTLLVKSLQDIALGREKGDPVRVRAAATLLAKVLPDVQSMSISNETPPPNLTVEEVREQMKHLARNELLAMDPAQRRELLEDTVELIPLEKSNASA